MRRLGIVVLTLIVILGLAGFVAKRVLLDTATVPARSQQEINLGALRGAARNIEGPLPLRINSELIGESALPSFAVVAGTGFGPHPMVRVAYQVVYPRGHVILDAAMDRELSEELSPDAAFYPDRYAALQEALRTARAIVITHEHPDHIGGISKTPFPDEVWPRVTLTREQSESHMQLDRAQFPARAHDAVQVIDFEKLHTLAPGIVLMKAPGHTPGTQLVYVLLEGGREFLFVGDVVWDMENVVRLTGRPRIVTDWIVGEDRDVVLEQVRMLHDFSRRHDDVHIVVSHDEGQYRAYLRSGVLAPEFE